MTATETASLITSFLVIRFVPSAASYNSSIRWKSVNAKLNHLLDLSAHRVFSTVFEIGAIFFQGIRRDIIGASAVSVTVTKVTFYRVYTTKTENDQEAQDEDE